ncbi:MAG: MFS transporter [Candidatus Margulisbacteria bacterium]|nr:MFS transporter [Candidatus Margulisiibacteriota bacterium]
MSFFKTLKNSFNILVVVAALGYFVDIYDLVLFGMLRVKSLVGLGLSGPALLESGVHLLNMQMLGMLLGGILWGVLGDKKGRVSVLFGSICLYSLANIANGFVTTVPWYAVCRFLAGIGLAGELGAGVTLVAETLSKKHRGYGVMIVATVGVLGAVGAAFMANRVSWQMNYFVGGALGLALLVMRVGAYESGLFDKMRKNASVKRGNFLLLFRYKDLFYRYILCILVGVPLWYMVGIIVMFAPEFAAVLHVNGEVSAVNAILYCYLGLAVGDFLSGSLSQWFQNRRKVMLGFMVMMFASICVLLKSFGVSAEQFYWICFVMGIFAGYWALFITVAAEQFGTNFRATVATTVPNFVRGSVVLLTFVMTFFKSYMSLLQATFWLGVVVFILSSVSVLMLSETFHRDLDFVEELP